MGTNLEKNKIAILPYQLAILRDLTSLLIVKCAKAKVRHLMCVLEQTALSCGLSHLIINW